MEEGKLDEFRSDFSLLIEAGFVAVKQLDEISATRIFQAAQILSPLSTAPQLGIGYIALNKLEVKTATKTFEEIVQKEPNNYLAQTFLAICFLLTKPKRSLGEKMIRDVIQNTSDPTIKDLAKMSIEWAAKDLNKEKAPFFASQKQDS